MGNGFDDALQRRNLLERLIGKIPGFKGYQDRELRRDVDRMQREFMATKLGQLKAALRGVARDFTDAGQIGTLHLFERLDRGIDGFSQAVRFTDYGASGLFDVIKVYEQELEKLYEFDLGLLEDLEALAADLAAVPRPGEGDPQPELDKALDRVTALHGKWADRKNVIANVVQTSA